MTPVEYVGKKPNKTDTETTFGTYLVWKGPGDIQMVEDVIAKQMVEKYPEVWAYPVQAEALEDPEEDTDPGDPDADPDEDLNDFANMHWQSAVKYIKEVDIEELADLWKIEKARKNGGRSPVLDAIADRLS